MDIVTVLNIKICRMKIDENDQKRIKHYVHNPSSIQYSPLVKDALSNYVDK